MKTQTIKVELSQAQFDVFAPAAKDLGTDVGSLLLAFAYMAVSTNPTGFAYDEIASELWQSCHRRELPKIDEGWVEGGVEFATTASKEDAA